MALKNYCYLDVTYAGFAGAGHRENCILQVGLPLSAHGTQWALHTHAMMEPARSLKEDKFFCCGTVAAI